MSDRRYNQYPPRPPRTWLLRLLCAMLLLAVAADIVKAVR